MKKAAKQTKVKSLTIKLPLKLNLGCGTSKMDGYVGVDISPKCKPDVVHDLSKAPWPWKDNSVDEIYCSHFYEHLDGTQRITFMNEAHRVMKPKAIMRVITPAPFTHRYCQDPTHKFPMVVQEGYNYFNQAWLKANGLEHYGITANFDWGGVMHEDAQVLGGRNDEYRAFGARHYINTMTDLDINLTKIDETPA